MANDSFERAITKLHEANVILDMKLDYINNCARITITLPENLRETILFSGLIDLRYAPDFSDHPPWLVGKVKIEKVCDESDLVGGEGLWVHGKRSYADAFPCYRVSLQSADFRLTILCLRIKALDLKSRTQG